MESRTDQHTRAHPPRDLAVLLSAFALVALALALLLAFAVPLGGTRKIDDKILQSVRRLVERTESPGRVLAEESVIAITGLGSQIVLIGLTCSVGGLLLLTRRFNDCIFLVVVLVGAIALNYCLKALFARARPDVVTHLQRVNTHSFPSGHSLVSTAVYTALGAVGANLLRGQPRLKIYVITIAASLTFLVGLSRIYLGVHYPSDVLAGWAVGFLWAFLCLRMTRYSQRRFTDPK